LKLHPLAKDPGLIFKMKKFKNEENERSLIWELFLKVESPFCVTNWLEFLHPGMDSSWIQR
jgi:hypothetical protein